MSTDPLILGLDAMPCGGASLLRGNEVVVAIREERLSRVEGDAIRASLPCLALRYCQDAAGIELRDIDLVVCRSAGPADRWPDDITLNPQLQIPRNNFAWMAIPSDREPNGRASDAGISAARQGLERRFGCTVADSRCGRDGGRSYSADEVLAAIESLPGAIRRVPVDSVIEAVADRLSAGGAAGWFQGPSACAGDGRAGRMLLYRPRSGVSHEQAPTDIVLADGEAIPFDIVTTADDVAQQPADTRLHRLLEELGRRTGRPFAYCAPFRAIGEPAVETPDDAIWTALQLGLEVCAIDDTIIEPVAPSGSLLDLVPTINAVECVISATCRQGAVDETMATKGITADVTTPWGTATRTMNPLQLALLIEMDGRSSGWQLLERINRNGRKRMAASWLLRALAELRRLGIIALDAAPGGVVGRR